MMSKIESNATIKDLAELLIALVPDVVTAFKIFLTLPVTVASAERSFSKLKLIKNYMRSTMSQDMLSGLSILCIENERARNLDLSEIVKQFAEKMQDAESAFHNTIGHHTLTILQLLAAFFVYIHDFQCYIHLITLSSSVLCYDS